MYEKIHQWSTVNQGLLQINTDEKQNYPRTFRECCKSKLHNIYRTPYQVHGKDYLWP